MRHASAPRHACVTDSLPLVRTSFRCLIGGWSCRGNSPILHAPRCHSYIVIKVRLASSSSTGIDRQSEEKDLLSYGVQMIVFIGIGKTASDVKFRSRFSDVIILVQ